MDRSFQDYMVTSRQEMQGRMNLWGSLSKWDASQVCQS